MRRNKTFTGILLISTISLMVFSGCSVQTPPASSEQAAANQSSLSEVQQPSANSSLQSVGTFSTQDVYGNDYTQEVFGGLRSYYGKYFYHMVYALCRRNA